MRRLVFFAALALALRLACLWLPVQAADSMLR